MDSKTNILLRLYLGSIGISMIGLSFKIYSMNKGYRDAKRSFKYKKMSNETKIEKDQMDVFIFKEIMKELGVSLIPFVNIIRGLENMADFDDNYKYYQSKFRDNFEKLNEIEEKNKKRVLKME